MSKNKNNKPIWGTRIKKNASTLFKKVGGSLPIDKRLFKEDIEGSIAHVEMLHKQKIINFKIKNTLDTQGTLEESKKLPLKNYTIQNLVKFLMKL